MPRVDVEGVGEIDFPDDMSEEQIAEAIETELVPAMKRERVSRNARMAYTSMTPGQKFSAGFARPFMELGYGIKDLAGSKREVSDPLNKGAAHQPIIGGGLTDEDRDNLARLEEVTGGAGTAGRITGELATFAVPASAGVKAAAMLPRAIARFAPVAADIGMTAGVEALKAPAEGETRADNATEGALGALGGAVAGKVLKSAVRGLKPRPEAEQFLRDDIPLTPGQMKGGAVQGAENFLSDVPLVGSAIRNRQQEAIEAWNRKLLNRAAPSGRITEAGPEGFKQASAAFKDAYSTLWDRDIPLSTAQLSRAWTQTLGQAPPEAGQAVAVKLQRLFETDLLPGRHGGQVRGTAIEHVDDALRNEATASARRGAGDEAQVYNAARAQLRGLMPEQVSKNLTMLDTKYREFMAMTKAASYVGAQRQGGVFTPAQLQTASAAKDRSKAATAQGRATLQPEAAEALEVLGTPRTRGPSGVGSGALGLGVLFDPSTTATVGIPTRLAYTRGGNRILRGQSAAQKALQAAADQKIARALREWGLRGVPIGAAVEE